MAAGDAFFDAVEGIELECTEDFAATTYRPRPHGPFKPRRPSVIVAMSNENAPRSHVDREAWESAMDAAAGAF